MSTAHHGSAPLGDEKPVDREALKRLVDQINGTARREYPAGRMGAHDDGALAYGIATDSVGTIIIRFGKPVEWIGLRAEDAEALRDKLSEKLLELRGISK